MTAGCGLVLGLLAAVLVGVVLTLLLVLSSSTASASRSSSRPPTGPRVAGPDTAPVDGLLVLRLDAPLYTANVRSVNRQVLDRASARQDVKVVVLDASAVAVLTVMVMDQWLELSAQLHERGVTLWVAALSAQALAEVRKSSRWADIEASGHLFPTSLAAVRAYRAAAAD